MQIIIKWVPSLAPKIPFIQTSHRNQISPADPVSRANSHSLILAWWHAEDPISSGVPPPLPLLVDVDVLELEVELCV